MNNINKIVISFSGGRTSAYMTLWLLNSEKYKDYEKVIVFANTGKERSETLDFVNQFEQHINHRIFWLEAVVNPEKGQGTRHKIVGYNTASRNGEPFEDVIKKYSIPNQNFIHCTRELKLAPIKSFLRSIGWKKGDYYEAIGIRADETRRINWKQAEKDNKIYPLVTDIRIDSMFVRKFWDSMPFDLQLKDYEGNCDLCYKKSKRKLLTILTENPHLINWWNDMEIKYGNEELYFYRGNTSCIELLEQSTGKFTKAKDKFQAFKDSPTLFERFDYDLDGESSCTCGVD
jgi:hypothetical protein